MCQFLIGTVLHTGICVTYEPENANFEMCQFLIGTVLQENGLLDEERARSVEATCQFLIGTVLRAEAAELCVINKISTVSIPHRYGTTVGGFYGVIVGFLYHCVNSS